MKKVLTRLFTTVSLLAFPAAAVAETTVDSTTVFRLFQDSRAGYDTKEFAPALQFLGLDVNGLHGGDLSLHFYGWGRVDLAEKSYNNQQADGNLTYGYAQYRFKAANAQARAGRFFVHEGIVNEQVDGVSARTDLPYGFGLSTFGGATVHTTDIPGESTDGKGDAVFGGRVNYRYGGLLELGLAGVYETKAPTLTSTAYAGRFGDHRLVGGDIWLSPHRMVQLMGRTSYNTETSGIAEQSYLLQLTPLKDLVVTGEFNDYHDRDLFYSSAFFAGLLNGNNLNQDSRSYGGTATYTVNSQVEVGGDFKHYTRDIGKADRFGGEVRYANAKNAVRAGAGYHYLRTSPDFAIIPSSDASGSFHEVRGYAMRDTKSYFTALDLIGYFFKKDVKGRDAAWEATGSVGYHFTPALAISGDVSYGSNPQYTDEFKGLLRLTYTMKTAAKGDTK
ncbi:hypothetical protein LPW11_04205 [Geomonas sp. RF6]|uniref:hypothetical protein n=1 Tax=Geomonas sp. RF6 TaxID=2897342 RepID=UPI001E53AADC|nr:hypothetical protein [Geomonas sp. RF6]UFS71402.1 hypothetical protein LPW11_04205 [Geomonas sp. RF6]